MALLERTFGGLPSGEAWIYLDSAQSEVVDATASELPLFSVSFV